jgi:hypothetical protein
MFLFAVRQDRLTALAPYRDHRCFLQLPDGSEMELTDHVVTLFKGEQQATGRIADNSEPRIVHLNDVLGTGAYFLKSDAELDTLASARFELGGDTCSLDSHPIESPGDPAYDDVEWWFGGHFKHRLTNRANFTLAFAPNYRLEVKDRKTGRVARTWALEDGHTIVARTEDMPKEVAIPRKTLREFAHLYDFLSDQDGNGMLGPIPTELPQEAPSARSARIASRRMAGGASMLCIDPVCPGAVCEG